MFSDFDKAIMKRCLHLAAKGRTSVKSNPMVGCVITYAGRILAEGYHEVFGGPHAEANALNHVNTSDKPLLSKSCMYVTLEPCNHYGKTPPCSESIVQNKIPELVIGSTDPNPKMQGLSISRLRETGILVRQGLFSQEESLLNQIYRINVIQQMPFVVIKYAQSKDGFMGQPGRQIWLSNNLSKWAVHKWRSEIDGILVGTDTIITDNPRLTNRLYPGESPVRIVIDRNGRIPPSSHVLSDDKETWIYTQKSDYALEAPNKKIIHQKEISDDLTDVMQDLFLRGVKSLMVEGGRQILSTLIKYNLWHEARIIETQVELEHGIKTPFLKGRVKQQYQLNNDNILIVSSLDLINLLEVN